MIKYNRVGPAWEILLREIVHAVITKHSQYAGSIHLHPRFFLYCIRHFHKYVQHEIQLKFCQFLNFFRTSFDDRLVTSSEFWDRNGFQI